MSVDAECLDKTSLFDLIHETDLVLVVSYRRGVHCSVSIRDL